MRVNKDNLTFALIGVVIGISASFLYGKEPPAKPSKGFKSFYLSFEKSADLGVFKASGALVELSKTHSTHGKHSLMARIQAGSDYPGLQWEVYGKASQNWSRAKDFHFDVYNNSEDTLMMDVKFKSGREYPKKSHTYPVELEPLKMNTVSIPIESIAEPCDITQMSYVKLFIKSPQKEIVLYFDNIGIRQGTKDDEKGDIKNSAVTQERQPLARALKDKEEVFIASSLDRIFQDGRTLGKPSFTQSANVLLAKNEYESFQVVVANGKNELKDAHLEIEFPEGKIEIIWRKVGYVPTKKPYYTVKFVGMWPDPLLQADKIDIKPGITQAFWVTLYAPADTAAGTYQGKINVISEDTVLKEIPLTVKVLNFMLPLESHLKTAFDFYGHITYKRFPRKEKETDEAYKSRLSEVNERFIINMLKHRMNPVLNIEPVSQEGLSRIDNYRRYGLNNFSIGKRGGTFNNNWPSTDEEIEKLLPLYREYGESLKFNRVLEYAYIYTWDESKMNNPQVAKICSMIHRAHPGLKNMVCYHGFWDPAKYPNWGKDIDIWCFGIDDFNATKVKTLRDMGMEMWMYISGPSGSGSPNLAIDFDSMSYRIIPWLCWKYDLKGFLYWCVNWWPLVDPYQNAANTKWEQNGNGLLFYPGDDAPVDSLRAEIYRDGMEDYEYLYLLAEKVKAVKLKNLEKNNKDLINRAESLLNIDKSIAGSMREYTKDLDVIFNRRQKIALMIEELNEK